MNPRELIKEINQQRTLINTLKASLKIQSPELKPIEAHDYDSLCPKLEQQIINQRMHIYLLLELIELERWHFINSESETRPFDACSFCPNKVHAKGLCANHYRSENRKQKRIKQLGFNTPECDYCGAEMKLTKAALKSALKKSAQKKNKSAEKKRVCVLCWRSKSLFSQ